MNEKYTKLKTLLMELFQLDQPDLDFGFYRVMHAKSAEVTQFLERDLLPQVRAAFAQYKKADKAEIEKNLAKAIEQAQGLGVDPESTQKVKDLRAELADEAVDLGALESEVYDHLYSFFRRYYSDGDFLSKRVYKPGVYAIPYEGEEVKLHWANADQYYIKTSEYLRDYAFRLRPEDNKNPMRVHFRLAEAAEGEHGNVKEEAGKERRFKLASDAPVIIEDGELILRFTYLPDSAKQKDLNAAAEQTVLTVSTPSIRDWITGLGAKHVRADGTQSECTRLRVHLDRYTARNTFDYFIHKDLGGFLRRELDFYIKNEVMHLDDVENETAARVEQYLSKIKVIRRIAGKVTDFLSQLEDFQKKLWLKKKFVVETSWCVTLDRIPESLYPAILANDAQREEWVRQLAIDSIRDVGTAQQSFLPSEPAPYSVPLTMAFLRANKHLPVDTSFFDADFTARLLEAQELLDRTLAGTLIHGDNFQAMSLLAGRLDSSVKCVYIDPPYNTDSSSIPYKNDYKHSSYGAMILDRLALLRRTLRPDGAIFVSIDKAERSIVQHVLDDVFGPTNRVEELIWVMNTNNSQAPSYSTNHEYVEVYARDRRNAEQARRMFREPKPGFEDVMELVNRLNEEYPTTAKIEQELRALYDRHRIEFRDQVEAQGLEWDEEKGNDPWKGLYNYSHAEYRDESGCLVSESEARTLKARIYVWRESDISMPATKQAASTRDPDHPNYRFYRPRHPVTGKPCPHPKSGWKYAYASDDVSQDRKTFVSLNADNRIVWGPDETKVPQLKRMLDEVGVNVSKSVFVDYSDGEKQTSAMFGRSGLFLAPKHSDFVARFILQSGATEGTVLDCFGGSGSTAHAVIKLNRADRGSRQFILAEVAGYFDEVLKPRVLKAAYSAEWRGGKPLMRDGVSHITKVIRLESYEDALNNLENHRTDQQEALLHLAAAEGENKLREQYLLRYMLDVETQGSQSLLNIAAFVDPTAYKLKVKRPGSDESRELRVDLLETFDWLIGLTVQHIAAPRSFNASLKRDEDKDLPSDAPRRILLDGRLKEDPAGRWWFRTVTGTTPDGRKTLIIWRKRPGGDTPEGIEEDNLVLNEWFAKQGYSSKDSEFDLIYVNGGNNVENLKAPDDTWKVRLIEEHFHRLMFEAGGL